MRQIFRSCLLKMPSHLAHFVPMAAFFGNSDLKPLGIDRAAKSRALRALEQGGLVKINRQQGRFPTVTLICTARSGKL